MGTEIIKVHDPEDSVSNCESVTSTNNYSCASTVQVNSVNCFDGGSEKLSSSSSGPSSCRSSIRYNSQNTPSFAGTEISDSFTSKNSIVNEINSHDAVVATTGKPHSFEIRQQENAKKKILWSSAHEEDCNGGDEYKTGDEYKHSVSFSRDQILESRAHCKGIISRLIDKELIRTTIMEQDEDSLPRGIQQGHFKNLTHLDISGNSAEKLDLRSLSRLEWLCCANNSLEVLYLSGCSLTYLDCSYNNLHSISVDPIPNNLATLQISYNVMDDLPKWIFMVPELYTVHASHNHIRQLDCKFQNCLSTLPVRELYLNCNKIEFVSKDFIQRATKLKILNLSQNLIEYMPNFGKKCPIQELSLSRNRLQDTDDKDALDFLLECSHLKRLFLGFNRIEHLSERCLSAWKSMEELVLCGNRFRHIPSKISSMSNLRVLRVHSNRLETVPSLNKMPALKMVDLSHNLLRKINIENLISGGNLTYLDISCNEKLTVNPEKLHCQKRPMNLVEVSNPRKKIPPGMKNNDLKEFPANPPWEIGFSELPDRNLTLSVTQYRDINLSYGKEALFGIFDGGDGNPAPKYIPKCIAKIYAEEKNIEENSNFSLKYTLLNAMKNVRQLGSHKPIQGLLCLLSMHEDDLVPGPPTFQLDLAMIGGIRCLLVESGRKISRLTDMVEETNEGKHPMHSSSRHSTSTTPTMSSEESSQSSLDSQSDTSSIRSRSTSYVTTTKNNLNGNIPDPKLFSIPLTTAAEYLVIANQSLWNHMSEEEIISEIEFNKNKKSVLVAKKLTDLAQSHSCKNCLSVIIVRFKWHFTSTGIGRGGHQGERQKVSQQISELGPLSYCSGSSEYSDVSNPLVSVTTPDSAIDSDRSSRTSTASSSASETVNGSNSGVGGNVEFKAKSSKSSSNQRRSSENSGSSKSEDNRTSSRKLFGKVSKKDDVVGSKSERIPYGHQKKSREDEEDAVSLANTSISQMSVEQFKCWEYMLEQNTKLLFKKELDTLSKGVFQRNQKMRKSVHFPYQQQPDQQLLTQSTNGKKNKSVQNLFQYPGGQVTETSTPGFYTLSKAKSLSHLFGVGDATNKKGGETGQPTGSTSGGVPMATPQAYVSPNNVQTFVNGFATKFPAVLNNNANGTTSSNIASNVASNLASGFLGSVRSNAKKGLIGGPTAAYFGSVQRIVPPAVLAQHQHYPSYYGPAEIQEIKNLDSGDHDNRLKKYWENKITEL